MKHRWGRTHVYRRLALPLACSITAFAVACGQLSSPGDAPPGTVTEPTAGLPGLGTNPDTLVGDELAQLRTVTARFHDIAVADSAGYDIRLTGCMTDPTLGGMGFHYGNGGLIDATVNEREPEVLLYEPQANGRLRLVAVEYIVPYTLAPREGPAPTLFGRDFRQNDDFQLWGLHAWVWRDNPAGMFADWNPNVNCDAVPAAARMSHESD
jgi:hypothetical protein